MLSLSPLTRCVSELLSIRSGLKSSFIRSSKRCIRGSSYCSHRTKLRCTISTSGWTCKERRLECLIFRMVRVPSQQLSKSMCFPRMILRRTPARKRCRQADSPRSLHRIRHISHKSQRKSAKASDSETILTIEQPSILKKHH